MDTASNKSHSMVSTAGMRKSNIVNHGKDIIKSPYNKTKIEDINFVKKPKKKHIKGFPTEIDINNFLKQLSFHKLTKLASAFMGKVSSLTDSIGKGAYKRIMEELFNPPPAASLRDLLYKRFKPLKFTEDGKELDIEKQEMIVIDFMVALASLSRAIPKYTDKLKLIFNFCDDDGDHCMRADEILLMIQRLERIFCKECAQINLESQLLLQSIADKRAETKFHYIIRLIRKKEKRIKIEDGDELITYREFQQAVKSDPAFYKTILPRTLNMEDVLMSTKTEEVYNISDVSYDDFLLFR